MGVDEPESSAKSPFVVILASVVERGSRNAVFLGTERRESQWAPAKDNRLRVGRFRKERSPPRRLVHAGEMSIHYPACVM
jgi:hypothetical protein